MIQGNHFLLSALLLFNLNCFSQFETEQQRITTFDQTDAYSFGFRLDFHQDHAIISAPGNKTSDSDTLEYVYAGAAFAFTKDTAGQWTQVQKLTAVNRGNYGNFGCSVSVNDTFAVIGSSGDDLDSSGLNIIGDAGAAYIYKLDTNGHWQPFQKIVASDRVKLAKFGQVVQLNGNYLAVSAPGYLPDSLSSTNAFRPGAAYIFELNGDGLWEEKQQIHNLVKDHGGFGKVLDFNGTTLALGMPFRRVNGGIPEGNIIVYEKDSANVWQEHQLLELNDRNSPGYYMGDAISIHGNEMAVSEKGDVVLIYVKNSAGNWVLDQLIPGNLPVGSWVEFGADIALEDDYLLVGAPSSKENMFGSYIETGAAYLYERDVSGQWVRKSTLISTKQVKGDFFGSAVSFRGHDMLISANLEGAAYYFDLNSLSLSVPEISASDYILFPNPTKGTFTLRLLTGGSATSVVITDISGKILERLDDPGRNDLQFNLSAPPGMYFVHIQTNQGFAVSKVIKE